MSLYTMSGASTSRSASEADKKGKKPMWCRLRSGFHKVVDACRSTPKAAPPRNVTIDQTLGHPVIPDHTDVPDEDPLQAIVSEENLLANTQRTTPQSDSQIGTVPRAERPIVTDRRLHSLLDKPLPLQVANSSPVSNRPGGSNAPTGNPEDGFQSLKNDVKFRYLTDHNVSSPKDDSQTAQSDDSKRRLFRPPSTVSSLPEYAAAPSLQPAQQSSGSTLPVLSSPPTNPRDLTPTFWQINRYLGYDGNKLQTLLSEDPQNRRDVVLQAAELLQVPLAEAGLRLTIGDIDSIDYRQSEQVLDISQEGQEYINKRFEEGELFMKNLHKNKTSLSSPDVRKVHESTAIRQFERCFGKLGLSITVTHHLVQGSKS